MGHTTAGAGPEPPTRHPEAVKNHGPARAGCRPLPGFEVLPAPNVTQSVCQTSAPLAEPETEPVRLLARHHSRCCSSTRTADSPRREPKLCDGVHDPASVIGTRTHRAHGGLAPSCCSLKLPRRLQAGLGLRCARERATNLASRDSAVVPSSVLRTFGFVLPQAGPTREAHCSESSVRPSSAGPATSARTVRSPFT